MIQKAFLPILALTAFAIAGCTNTPTSVHRTVTLNVERNGVLHAALHEVTTSPDTHTELHLGSPVIRYESGREVMVAVSTFTENSGYKNAEDYLMNSPDAYGILLRGTVTDTSPNKARVAVANLTSKNKGEPAFTLKWEGDVEIGKPTVIFDQTAAIPAESRSRRRE